LPCHGANVEELSHEFIRPAYHSVNVDSSRNKTAGTSA